MRKQLCASLLAAVGLLVDAPAHADDFATVNGIALSQTGFVVHQFPVGVTVLPGQSVDFSFSYSISLHDGGLPAPFDAASTGCLSIHLFVCGPAYTGFEVVQAAVLFLYTDPRSIPAYVHGTGDNNLVVLFTQGDSFADSLSLSGTIHQTISNSDPIATYSRIYTTYLALWVLASPIPEPATWAQLLVGLVGVALLKRVQLRAAAPSRWQNKGGEIRR